MSKILFKNKKIRKFFFLGEGEQTKREKRERWREREGRPERFPVREDNQLFLNKV